MRGGRAFARETVWGCWVELQDRGQQCELRPEERFSYFGLTGAYPKSVLTIPMSEFSVFLTRITQPRSDRWSPKLLRRSSPLQTNTKRTGRWSPFAGMISNRRLTSPWIKLCFSIKYENTDLSSFSFRQIINNCSFLEKKLSIVVLIDLFYFFLLRPHVLKGHF